MKKRLVGQGLAIQEIGFQEESGAAILPHSGQDTDQRHGNGKGKGKRKGKGRKERNEKQA